MVDISELVVAQIVKTNGTYTQQHKIDRAPTITWLFTLERCKFAVWYNGGTFQMHREPETTVAFRI